MTTKNIFKYFKTSPEIICLAVMYYVRYPLSFRQVEDILHDRGIDICHETVRYWVEHFGLKFAREIRKKRVGHHSNWQWHLDEVFVKINGDRFYHWRAVEHEGEVMECYVSKRRDKRAAKKFLIKQCGNMGHQRLSQLTSCHHMALHFVTLALLIDNFAADDPTTDVRILICHFEGERGQCRSSEVLHPFKYLRQFMDKSTITSITKDICRNEIITRYYVQPLFLSGRRFAFNTNLSVSILRSINVCLTTPFSSISPPFRLTPRRTQPSKAAAADIG